jgi:hypothetical protein
VSGKCPGLHCQGCGKGGLSAGAIVVLILFVLAVADHHAISDGVGEFLHGVEVVLEVLVFTLAALVAIAAAAGLTWAGIRIRRRQQRQAVTARAPVVVLSSTLSRDAAAWPLAGTTPTIAPAREPLYVHTQAEPREAVGRPVPGRPR